MTDKITKPPESIEKPTERVKFGIPKLHQKMAKAAQAEPPAQADPTTLANRIGLLLDVSGSMAETEQTEGHYQEPIGRPKIEHLKDAIQGFVAACDWDTTGVAVETFPGPSDRNDYDHFGDYSRQLGGMSMGASLPLTTNSGLLTLTALGLEAHGGTPMGVAMEKTAHLTTQSRTPFLMSDGESDCGGERALPVAGNYREADVAIDCIHIGSTKRGEQLLIQIAEKTGGMYIKFKDVASFAKIVQIPHSRWSVSTPAHG
jgi:hypothetical protein